MCTNKNFIGHSPDSAKARKKQRELSQRGEDPAFQKAMKESLAPGLPRDPEVTPAKAKFGMPKEDLPKDPET